MKCSDPTGRLGHPRFSCKHCGSDFARYPSTVKHDRPVFCSGDCTYAYRRIHGHNAKVKVECKCETCGNIRFLSPKKAATNRFCSQECMIVWRSTLRLKYDENAHTDVVCKFCGESFSTHKCRIDGVRGKFCSRSCSASFHIRHSARSISKAEIRFGNEMSEAGLIFEAQAKIGKMIVDYAFHEHRLVVEYDGEYWHSLPKSIERDIKKNARLRDLGYDVLRIPERTHIINKSDALRLVVDRLCSIESEAQYET